jgi:hypothetical protein
MKSFYKEPSSGNSETTGTVDKGRAKEKERKDVAVHDDDAGGGVNGDYEEDEEEELPAQGSILRNSISAENFSYKIFILKHVQIFTQRQYVDSNFSEYYGQ